MSNDRRLIEVAFPLKQASLDSVHEKNVRHGHISTLHIWPARRPLAACRAALIATLLPDPGTPEERQKLAERIGGKLVQKVEKKKIAGRIVEVMKEETVGGVLHWGRETSPDMDWFRQKIRDAYGGRAPRVLDPFAGGGAIPLEAMRLGCEATAIDINPVAWFILKCTLEYPQRFAGEKRPLPSFVTSDREFMEAFFKAQGLKGATLRTQLERLDLGRRGDDLPLGFGTASAGIEADLAWHVRAWGRWVLQHAKKDLERFYPVIDGKPTVAYLWARTVRCKNCRATIPLLKTRWLCKKDKRRVVLAMKPNRDKTGVVFGIETDVPIAGGNAAQRREHDKRTGQGTMSRNGAWCPCCGHPGTVAMEMEDIRQEGLKDRMSTVITAVVVDLPTGKGYRMPTPGEVDLAAAAERHIEDLFSEVPFGVPDESLPTKEALGFRVPLYGIDRWGKLFTSRQLVALGTFVRHTRAARLAVDRAGYPGYWLEALVAYLACGLDRLVDFANVNTQWKIDVPTINHALVRFALPIVWDFAEGNPIGTLAGSYQMCLDRISTGLETVLHLGPTCAPPTVNIGSATSFSAHADVVVTDPPYYDAIPYSDLMDWFYVWLRRTVFDLSDDYKRAMKSSVGPKWDKDRHDGELIDDAGRHGGNSELSKREYEDGMARAFARCREALGEKGRLVVVFANKQPDAWETLVSSVVRAGFVAEGSWPIQTEQPSRSRGQASAALSSSVWLVAKPRSPVARPGWDNQVLEEMRTNISDRLREFWDAGIRGPDFVWAATGPALEAYSKHPVVKKANAPGELMTVSEFLRHVRRMVVEFVVGRVLSGNGDSEVVSGLDDVTTYYLLHRNDFKMDDAPTGACILYAISCGLSDRELADQYDILVRTGGKGADEDDETEEETEGTDEPAEGTGSRMKLKSWTQRHRKSLGEDGAGRPSPLIDRIHRLMHLWKAGDAVKVNEYLDAKGLRPNVLFHQVLQALIELAEAGSEERSLLESISNHVAARGTSPEEKNRAFAFMNE